MFCRSFVPGTGSVPGAHASGSDRHTCHDPSALFQAATKPRAAEVGAMKHCHVRVIGLVAGGGGLVWHRRPHRDNPHVPYQLRIPSQGHRACAVTLVGWGTLQHVLHGASEWWAVTHLRANSAAAPDGPITSHVTSPLPAATAASTAAAAAATPSSAGRPAG